MEPNLKVSQYLAPRYWPTWFLLGAMYTSARLPLSAIYAVGVCIGELVYWLMPRRRNIAKTNIRLCFPNLSKAQQSRLVRKCFHSVGKSVLETSLAWWGEDSRLQKLVKIDGLEHIDQALRDNRPVILLSGHMACTEIGGKLLSFHQPFQVIYKPAKNRLLNTFAESKRGNIYTDIVPRKQSRRLLKNLKNKVLTWYGPDQSFGNEDIVFAPFFGVAAATLTATSRLARFADALVLPYFPYRLPDGKGYRLVIHPPLKNFPSNSLVDDAVRVNQIIEDAVRAAPEQYLWLHRRFHHRPDGEPQFY